MGRVRPLLKADPREFVNAQNTHVIRRLAGHMVVGVPTGEEEGAFREFCQLLPVFAFAPGASQPYGDPGVVITISGNGGGYPSGELRLGGGCLVRAE